MLRDTDNMGTSGPPGNIDIQNFFNTSTPPLVPSHNPPSGSYPPPNHGYHPSSHPYPHNTFSTGPYSSAGPGTYSFPQGPLHQSYMHYSQDQGPRAASYTSSPFVQSTFPQPPGVQHSTASQMHMTNTPSNTPLDGARLMALLTTQSSAESSSKEWTSFAATNPSSHPELPPSSSRDLGSSEVSRPPPAIAPALPTAPPVSLAPSTLSTRLSTRKLPKGRFLAGEHIIYDTDVRLPGEAQPQLEVSPITVYGSDPVLVVGRQIAVNKSYICYGLKNATIRVLSVHADLKLLIRGHSQRVTDMAFLSDDVHLLASASADGTIFVNQILESYSDDGKGQIKGMIIVAIRFLGDWESAHPRICWHSQAEDYLIVAIGKYVVTVNLAKVKLAAPSVGFTAEDPVTCHIKNPVEGVQVVGVHDAEVTELSTLPLMTSWLASSSNDGTVRIWGETKMLSQALFLPHEGHPVGFVSFLSVPHRPDHLVLLTAGPLNRELKMWVPTGPDGSFTVTGKWQCIQSLEFKSSAESKQDQAFFNQVLVIPSANIILLANAKKNALYAVSVEFGLVPAATRMVYLSEFSVTMPVLSFTALSDNVSDGEGTIRVYCVQTQAIQQYALDISQCLPPVREVSGETFKAFEKGPGHRILKLSGYSETHATQSVDQGAELKTDSEGTPVLAVKDFKDYVRKEDSPIILEEASTNISKSSLSTRRSHSKSPPKFHENIVQVPASFSSEDKAEKPSVQGYSVTSSGDSDNLSLETEGGLRLPHSNIEVEAATKAEETEGYLKANLEDQTLSLEQSSSLRSPHLITPSELMSMVARSKAEVDTSSISLPLKLDSSQAMVAEFEQNVPSVKPVSVSDTKPLNVDVNVSTQTTSSIDKDLITERLENLDVTGISEVIKAPKAAGSLQSTEQIIDVDASMDLSSRDGISIKEVQEEGELFEDPEKCFRASMTEETLEDATDDAIKMPDLNNTSVPSPVVVKGKKKKAKTNLVTPSPSFPPQLALTSTTSEMTTVEGDYSSNTNESVEGLTSQFSVMQNTLNQLVTMQKEFQKQMATMVGLPVAKEGKRIEASVGLRLEKVLKAHFELIWAKIQEDNAKRDKLEHERVQQLTTLLSNFLNKDLTSALERVLKELTLVGPTLVKLITPLIEKTISSAIGDVLQKGISEKTFPQLEKSITAKLDTCVAKHLQSQFQTSGRQALQDAMRSCFEGLVIPSFEKSCKAMFEQMDAAFQKGMAEHTSSTQQQFAASHTALAATLQDTVASASSLAASLKGELADGHRKLVAIAESASSSAPRFSLASKPSNGNLPDKVLSLQHLEESLDPTIEIARLVAARKFEDAFNRALSCNDVAVVSWLCNQVDPVALFATNPLPLSQAVVLSLVVQLGCDLGKDTARKLTWIREAALHLNPNDPVLAPHMRLFLDQLYNNLRRQLLVLPASGELTSALTLVIHVVNSLLTACK